MTMKKTFIGIIALLAIFCISASGQTANGSASGYDIRERNYPVYVLLGTFDIISPNKASHDDWGRAHKPRVPKVDNQGRTLRPEFEFAEDLLDAIYDGLSLGRRTMTQDIQSRTELKQFLNSQDEEVYTLEGTITKMESATKYTTSTINKRREINSIEATVHVNFVVVDLRTDKAVTTFELERSGSSTYRPSIDDAMSKALKSITRSIKVKLNEIFPTYGNVTQIGEIKKNKAESLFIDLGTDDGIESGNHFEVKKLTITNGKVVYKKVGKIKVTDDQGATASKCKVVSGGSKILTAIEEKCPLVIESYLGFWE